MDWRIFSDKVVQTNILLYFSANKYGLLLDNVKLIQRLTGLYGQYFSSGYGNIEKFIDLFICLWIQFMIVYDD